MKGLEPVIKSLRMTTKGLAILFAIKLFFVVISLIIQSCQKDDNSFKNSSTIQKELALNQFGEMAQETKAQLIPFLENIDKKNRLNENSFLNRTERNKGQIKKIIKPLVSESIHLASLYGIEKQFFIDEFGNLDDDRIAFVGLLILEIESYSNKKTANLINLGSLFGTLMFAQGNLYDCALRSIGITALNEAIRNSLNSSAGKAALKKAIRKIAARALGWIGAAWAIYEFVECMYG